MANFGIDMGSLNLNSIPVPSVTNSGRSQVSVGSANKNSRKPVFVDPEAMSTYISTTSSVTPSDSASNDIQKKMSIAQSAAHCNPDDNDNINASGPEDNNWANIVEGTDRITEWMSKSVLPNMPTASETERKLSTPPQSSLGITNKQLPESLQPNYPAMPLPSEEIRASKPTNTISEMFADESLPCDLQCKCQNCPYRAKYKALKARMKDALVRMIQEM
uniref:NSP5 n=1 Tax=Rotavirus K TaxID=2682575 RepID=A0A650D790_9REOV|nr:NSP5 [Rotavirus K]